MNNDTYGPTGLPVITSAITVEGNFSPIFRTNGVPEFRILAVGLTGNLTLQQTMITGGVALVTGGVALFADGGGIINRGTLTLTFSSVSRNTAGLSGGGIYNDGNLILTSSRVSGNTSHSQGGGVSNSGTLTLTNSTVSGNTVPIGEFSFSGGGISNRGTLTLTNSYITGNTVSGFGGGIDNYATVTLTNSTVSGNSASSSGGGIHTFDTNFGSASLTLANSTVSDNSASLSGGGIDTNGLNYTFGTLILTNSTVSGNTASYSGGGIEINNETVSLTNSTVSGNSASLSGGGIDTNGTLTLTNSTVEGNSAQSRGGGINNVPGSVDPGIHSILILTNSTISGNTAGAAGGGVGNDDLLTLINTTVSGNTAADRGGAVDNTGTATLTNSTVLRNASRRVGGGLFNTGTVTLVQSLLSGNTAQVIAPEAYNASGTVTGDSNVFGHDGFSGVAGFTLDATDLVPAVPLPAILDPMLSYNGGPTRTHGLVFGSPAVDAVPGAACATGTDQRGAPWPQDADGDTIPDCDIGAVERGLIPIQTEIISTTLDCRARGCRVSVRCNLLETECRNPIDITVRRAAVRATDGTLVKAPRRIRFAAGVTNIPPGGTQTMRLPLTPRGTRVVRTTEKKRLKGLLAIREIGATATNTPPATISNTRVTLRLRRR